MNANSSKSQKSTATLVAQELDLTLFNSWLKDSVKKPSELKHSALSESKPNSLNQSKTGLPDLSNVHAINPERYPFLLESVAKNKPIPGSDANLGQFDILFAFPQETFTLDNAFNAEVFVTQLQAEFSAAIVDEVVMQDIEGNTLSNIELPFKSGWFAYFSYDYAQVVEPVLHLPENQFSLAHLAQIPAAIINDHQNHKTWLIAEVEYQHLLTEMQADIAQYYEHVTASASTFYASEQALSSATKTHYSNNDKVDYLYANEENPQRYLDGVETIKEYILAGDVFQVNLSRNWQLELSPETSYLSVYHALRQSNPAPFAVLANFIDTANPQNNWQLMSSSPERLVKYESPWVETRPIAGTRKRGATTEADKALVNELIEHPKERAEHIMLIDLERNDLGRICEPGTVEVNDLMVVETYEHVHHIVSNVRGKLREGFSPLDIVHALFPGGTITGCPKIRCMQIVAELEQAPREAYTGSLGYINLDGSLDLNILIRTMIQHQHKGKNWVEFRAGAGIVADSEADFELVETRHKAKGLLKAFNQEQGTE